MPDMKDMKNKMNQDKEKSEEISAKRQEAEMDVTEKLKRATAAMRESTAEEKETAADEYTVVTGDSLSLIAQKLFNDKSQWKAIYEANKDVIGDDPNRIRPGQVFKIPNLD